MQQFVLVLGLMFCKVCFPCHGGGCYLSKESGEAWIFRLSMAMAMVGLVFMRVRIYVTIYVLVGMWLSHIGRVGIQNLAPFCRQLSL